MKILVLYSELAGYFQSCLRRFVQEYGAEAHVVRWPVHPDAPFKFEAEPGITYYERKDYDTKGLKELAKRLRPDLLYVTGWINKPYLQVARSMYQQGIPVVCAFDTQWKGSLRQKAAVAISRFALLNKFSHAWVPGLYQYEYARRLGFPKERILTGMYSADVDRFSEVAESVREAKKQSYPRRLLFVGRLLDIKGLPELCTAFVELSAELEHGWELLIVGEGALRDRLPRQANIQYRDFVQPEALPDLAAEAGAFVLPSRVEPWGVVLHEFAAAGLPLISTGQSGATTAFVREGFNGYLHLAGDKNSLKSVLKKLFVQDDSSLIQMGKRSEELAKQISPAIWAAQLKSIIDNY